MQQNPQKNSLALYFKVFKFRKTLQISHYEIDE